MLWQAECDSLYLGGKNVPGTIKMGVCGSVERLLLRYRCGVTDETCAELAKLVNMTRMDLRYGQLTNAGIAQLSHAMPRLEYCNVEGCKLTCLGMLALFRQHKGLRVWGPGVFLNAPPVYGVLIKPKCHFPGCELRL